MAKPNKETTLQKIIKSIIKKNNKLTKEEILILLENNINEERKQIVDAFEEGVKYGNGKLQTFDHPASRYYGFTYEEYQPIKKKIKSFYYLKNPNFTGISKEYKNFL